MDLNFITMNMCTLSCSHNYRSGFDCRWPHKSNCNFEYSVVSPDNNRQILFQMKRRRSQCKQPTGIIRSKHTHMTVAVTYRSYHVVNKITDLFQLIFHCGMANTAQCEYRRWVCVAHWMASLLRTVKRCLLLGKSASNMHTRIEIIEREFDEKCESIKY